MGCRSICGKPIEDATEKLQIHVTKRDIKKARQKNPMTCAVARGACDNDKRIISVRIGQRIALIEFNKKVIRYGIKNEDSERIRCFDIAKYFEPGIVELVPPKKKLGYHKKYRKKSGPSGKHVHRRIPLRHMWRTVAQ